jgi:arylsulfatase A
LIQNNNIFSNSIQMKKDRSVFSLTVIAIAICFASSAHAALPENARPNIVLLLTDDLGIGDVGCYNPKSKAPTPFMDKLARQGRRFTDAHSPSSVCSPTRYAILTGRYAWRTRLKLGVLNPWDEALIEKDRLTLPQMLKNQGYTTAAFGKWHLGWSWSTRGGQSQIPAKDQDYLDLIDLKKPITDGPTSRGFDYFFGMVGMTPSQPCLVENSQPIFDGKGDGPSIAGIDDALMKPWKEENTPAMLNQKAVRYIAERASEASKKPFFLYYAITTPHQPIMPSAEFRGKTGYGEACDFVTETDDSIGQILKALDQYGFADNTIVIVTSDNGSPGYAEADSPTASVMERYDHYPSGPWRGMKGDAYEGGHRIPLIIRWPGVIPAGTQSDETVCLVDMMSTCAKITGVRVPESAAEDSYDMTAALTGPKLDKPIREATVHHALIGMFAIRQGPWKLIQGIGSGGFTMPQFIAVKPGEIGRNGVAGQLYNLETDPGERQNLYRSQPEKAKELSDLLKRYQESGRSRPSS